MFKEYLDGLREKFDSIAFKYNHEELYMTIILHKGNDSVKCVIDHEMLADEEAMIEEIEERVKLFEKFDQVYDQLEEYLKGE